MPPTTDILFFYLQLIISVIYTIFIRSAKIQFENINYDIIIVNQYRFIKIIFLIINIIIINDNIKDQIYNYLFNISTDFLIR